VRPDDVRKVSSTEGRNQTSFDDSSLVGGAGRSSSSRHDHRPKHSHLCTKDHSRLRRLPCRHRGATGELDWLELPTARRHMYTCIFTTQRLTSKIVISASGQFRLLTLSSE
jgi:hypothetical protein